MADTSQSWLDFATLERTRTPNDALACSAEICLQASSSRGVIEAPAEAAAVAEALRRIEPSVEIRSEPTGDIRARYVAVTPVLRFKDDVDILIRPSGPGRARIAIYSRSRVGYSDLGTNARRIDDLERRLAAALSADR